MQQGLSMPQTMQNVLKRTNAQDLADYKQAASVEAGLRREFYDKFMALRLPFAACDNQDWEYILGAIGDGGRDRFWKEVLRQMRAALERTEKPGSLD